MKRILLLAAPVLLLASLATRLVHAETYQQKWGPVTATGPQGTAINYRQFGSVPSVYTVDWFNDGTAATACTYRVDGSADNVHWHPLSAVLSCTAYDAAGDGGSSSMIHIISKPVMYLRVNVLTFTAGDATTAVTFNYTRGS